MKRALIGLGLVMVGCGSSSDSPAPDAATRVDSGTPGDSGTPVDGGSQPGVFKLTSTFADGAAIPVENSCSGVNTSPVLTWANVPAAAQGLALTLIDPDAGNFKHWVIYDIPPTLAGLPAHVENGYAPGNVTGAHQTKSQQGATGYYGPCPPAQHTYHFTLYALDVATLPGASAATTAADAITAITAHMIAHTELVGTFQKP